MNKKLFRTIFSIMILLLMSSCAGKSGNSDKILMLNEREILEENLGVDIHGVSLSAAGYMLDFRYTVTDTEKAKPLFRRDVAPYLIDIDSGARMLVPSPAKVGPLRTSGQEPQVGRRYFIIFANPGKFIKSGNEVVVVIGDIRIEGLIVE